MTIQNRTQFSSLEAFGARKILAIRWWGVPKNEPFVRQRLWRIWSVEGRMPVKLVFSALKPDVRILTCI